MAFKIVIAGTYPEGVFETFRKNLQSPGVEVVEAVSQEAFDALTDADVVVLRILKMGKKDIERLPSLKAVVRWGVGYDTVDIETAGARGIYVCNTPGANAYAVAELTILMMMAVGRRLICHQKSIAEGLWCKNYLNSTRTLNNKMVGIIGGGNIGRQVAEKVHAFGARTQYYDPYRLKPEQEKALEMTYVSLEALLKTSDVVTIHVPLMPSTRHMIGREQLAMMKQGAILVNVARGGLVDEQAVLEAVESGRLLGAGIDTLEEEPPRVDSPLRGNPNIILTPHVGGDVPDVSDVAVPMICENLKKLAAGLRPDHIVNEKYLVQAVS